VQAFGFKEQVNNAKHFHCWVSLAFHPLIKRKHWNPVLIGKRLKRQTATVPLVNMSPFASVHMCQKPVSCLGNKRNSVNRRKIEIRALGGNEGAQFSRSAKPLTANSVRRKLIVEALFFGWVRSVSANANKLKRASALQINQAMLNAIGRAADLYDVVANALNEVHPRGFHSPHFHYAFSNPISTAAEMPVAFASVLAVGIVMPAPLMMLCMCPVESPVCSDRRLIEPRPLALIHAASGVSFAFFMPHR
jgi:hypothetical protein